MGAAEQYITLYEQNRDTIALHSPSALNAPREEAFRDFKRLGIPSLKVERYRYTDVEQVLKPDYGLNLSRLAIPIDPRKAFSCSVPTLSTYLYFVINDEFRPEVTHSKPLPQGVVVCSLAKAAEEHRELVERHYARLAPTRKDSLNALNTMLTQDGVFVYVPKNVALSRPLQVVNILRADVSLMANRRVLIVMEEGAQAQLLFCDHAADERQFLTTQVAEVFVGDRASLELYELEETHSLNHRLANMYVDVGEKAQVTLDSITLHNGLTRNRTDVSLRGAGSTVNMYGCVVADKQQRVDNNTLIEHRSPQCESNELYKYVLDGEAVGAFAGRVLVRQDAQKSSSREVNANLCASPSARMFSQPMLEIYADDVKCSHGSTVGQLNEAALFYMRQRGVSLEEARLLLKYAFVGEVIDSVRLEPLRDRLRYLTEARMRGSLSNCEGCKVCR
ncbi:MAG: Fe-S cluster assembly protein SufD [Prevotellaceae bacterium]|nr:Fe-S cluster assembly protein SufD [Prevotellaceae bacterium]